MSWAWDHRRMLADLTVQHMYMAFLPVLILGLFGGDVVLAQFNVPIAKVVPEKVIKSLHRLVKLVTFQSGANVNGSSIETRNDPTIMQRSAGTAGVPAC